MNCEGKQKRVISENTPPELGCQYAALRRSTKVLTGVAGYPAGWPPPPRQGNCHSKQESSPLGVIHIGSRALRSFAYLRARHSAYGPDLSYASGSDARIFKRKELFGSPKTSLPPF